MYSLLKLGGKAVVFRFDEETFQKRNKILQLPKDMEQAFE